MEFVTLAPFPTLPDLSRQAPRRAAGCPAPSDLTAQQVWDGLLRMYEHAPTLRKPSMDVRKCVMCANVWRPDSPECVGRVGQGRIGRWARSARDARQEPTPTPQVEPLRFGRSALSICAAICGCAYGTIWHTLEERDCSASHGNSWRVTPCYAPATGRQRKSKGGGRVRVIS